MFQPKVSPKQGQSENFLFLRTINGLLFPEIVGQDYEPFHHQSLTREKAEPAKILPEEEQIELQM